MLARDTQAFSELARQPMVHAHALTLPGAAWAAAGATHPLGTDFAGYSALDPADLESDRLHEYGSRITAELLGELMPFGTATDVLQRIRPYVEAGANHAIIYSVAGSLKPSLAAGAVVEQRRLMSGLKRLQRGRLTRR
ncbi:hypothetical protein [Mycobacterium sp.]|uniref:hypothetical protein n=1 Tax=Mycobacterium sp. TaxID=1785 RepID=UPI003D14BB08